MNLALLMSHIDAALETIDIPKLAPDGSNACDFFCADVVANRKFAQNHGGYPRSEIAEINDQVNDQLKLSLLQQMVDYSTGSNPNAGLSDVDIALSHRSKYQQAPSEMQDWLQGQLAIRDAKRAQAYEEMRKAASARVNPSQSDKSVVVEPE